MSRFHGPTARILIVEGVRAIDAASMDGSPTHARGDLVLCQMGPGPSQFPNVWLILDAELVAVESNRYISTYADDDLLSCWFPLVDVPFILIGLVRL